MDQKTKLHSESNKQTNWAKNNGRGRHGVRKSRRVRLLLKKSARQIYTTRRMSEPNKTAIPMECIVNSTTIYSHLERLCKMHFKIIKGIIEYIKLSDDDNNGRRQHFSNEPNKNSLALSPLCFKNVEHIASWQKNARVLIEGRNKSEWHFMLLYFCITSARRVKELAWYFFPRRSLFFGCCCCFCSVSLLLVQQHKTYNPIAFLHS